MIKNILAALVVAAMTATGSIAAEAAPGDRSGNRIGRPGSPCAGLIKGTWHYKRGRWMHISVTGTRRNVKATVSTVRFGVQHDATCTRLGRGAFELVLDNGDTYHIASDGSVTGHYGGPAFTGAYEDGGYEEPVETVGPQCNVILDGTWYYKNGRPMSIALSELHGRRFTSTVYVKNGPWVFGGRCVYNTRYDHTEITFDEGTTGSIVINADGTASGTVGNSGYIGTVRQ